MARGAPDPLTAQRETATDSRIYWIRVAVLVGVGFIVPIQAEEWSLNVATFHRASNACAVPSTFESAPATPRAVVPRVPTRFVQKYTLRARLEPSGSHEAIESRPGHAGDLGDGGLGDAQLEETPDVVLLAVEA